MKTPNCETVKRRLSTEKNKGLQSWKDVEISEQINNGSVTEEMSDFERLQMQTMKLALPLKLQRLLDKYRAMESVFAISQRKNQFFIGLAMIAQSVQRVTHKTFSKRDFQSILAFVPEFYSAQWTVSVCKATQKKELKLSVTAVDCEYSDLKGGDKQKKKGGGGIGIKFLKIWKVKERESIFQIRLCEYIRELHTRYLSENVLIEFDPFESGHTWHTRFDLENIADISVAKLPKKPTKNKNEIAKLMDSQTRKLNEIIESEMEKVKNEKKNKTKQATVPKHLKGLSPSFIAKIRAKSKNQQINRVKLSGKQRLKNGGRSEEQTRLKQLPYLVNLIRGIYVSANKSSMACNELIALVKKRHKNAYMASDEIWKQLQVLSEFGTNFFQIKKGPIVTVARLNKKAAMKRVFDNINQRMKK